MTVSSLGASTSAYSYLQSLLPQQTDDSKRAGSSDPVADLLKAFYPNGSSGAGAGPPDTSGGSSTGTFSPFNHDTMVALMSAQEQPSGGNPFVTARAQSLFSQLDGNGDGQVSQSEFENVFGSNADKSKVDGLFNALDGNGDGSVSLDELTSAAQAARAAHHHGHHHHGGGGQSVGQTIDALLTSGTQGASVDSTSNADGSNTTTISYADGSKVALTTPTGDSGAGADSTDSGGTNSGNTNSGNSNYANLLEQLIRLQAQVLSASSSQSLATSQTLASV
jgi:EF hand domain-containing protein